MSGGKVCRKLTCSRIEKKNSKKKKKKKKIKKKEEESTRSHLQLGNLHLVSFGLEVDCESRTTKVILVIYSTNHNQIS